MSERKITSESEVIVYSFIDENEESPIKWTPWIDRAEARDYAIANGYALVATTYEWFDEEIIADYRPAIERVYALDGTPSDAS